MVSRKARGGSTHPSTHGTHMVGTGGAGSMWGRLKVLGGGGCSVHPRPRVWEASTAWLAGPQVLSPASQGAVEGDTCHCAACAATAAGRSLVAAAEATPVSARRPALAAARASGAGPAQRGLRFPFQAPQARQPGALTWNSSLPAVTWSHRGQGIFSTRIEATAPPTGRTPLTTAWPRAHRPRCQRTRSSARSASR